VFGVLIYSFSFVHAVVKKETANERAHTVIEPQHVGDRTVYRDGRQFDELRLNPRHIPSRKAKIQTTGGTVRLENGRIQHVHAVGIATHPHLGRWIKRRAQEKITPGRMEIVKENFYIN
jgi:hypothetical protein